jgi:N-acetylmuramoyl-L-alanine amidase
LLCLLLTGCGQKEAPPAPKMAQLQQETAAEIMERIIVSPYAVEQYLGQLGNGHDFSWEQQFPPEYVMIHFCSAVVNHRDDPYNMEYVRQTFIDADVSIHYILDRDGTIYCYVPEDRSAWHAGKGTWLEDEKYTNKMNLYSIGIEVVGMGSQQDMSIYLSKAAYEALPKEYLGFTDAQYASLKVLVEDICHRNGIPLDRQHVIGHQEYSPKKNDPGQLFDWSRIVP